MKLQIDTVNKILKIEEAVNLNELIDALEKLFPNQEWKAYKLESTVINNWSNPIVIDRWGWNPYPTYPWITYGNSALALGNEVVLTNQIYNVSVN